MHVVSIPENCLFKYKVKEAECYPVQLLQIEYPRHRKLLEQICRVRNVPRIKIGTKFFCKWEGQTRRQIKQGQSFF